MDGWWARCGQGIKGQGSEGAAWMKDVAWSGGGLMQWMDDTLGQGPPEKPPHSGPPPPPPPLKVERSRGSGIAYRPSICVLP
jgi:hypothetical protein